MAVDNIYLLSFKKLALLLLPTMLRKVLYTNFSQIIVSPIASVHLSLNKYRLATKFYLEHNSQVCYLQAALNKKFDSIDKRIRVVDAGIKEPLLVYLREEQHLVSVPIREVGALIVSARGYSGADGFDFVVQVPLEIYSETNRQQISALINYFKLASKQCDITGI